MTDVDVGLKRALGSVSATCIVIGAIVGVGIFFTPSRVAAVTGSADLAMWCWALGGLGALLGGLVFAELGGMYGKTGGQYEILSDAYNPLVAFCFVFCNSTAVLAGAAAIIAIFCAENLGVMVNGAAPDARTVTWMSVVMIAGLAGANVIGVRWGAMIQNITVFAKLTTLLIVTALAAFAAPQVVAEASMSNAADPGGVAVAPLLFAGLVPALFSFGGWQHALWIGGEVKNPKRNVPLAIVAGVLIVIVVYLLANWAYFALLGYGGVVGSKALAADAVSVVWPDIGARMVAAAVAFSAFGVLNAQLLSGPRLLCGMARHGRFFRPFAHVHPRHGTPFPAIALIASRTVPTPAGRPLHHHAAQAASTAMQTMASPWVLAPSTRLSTRRWNERKRPPRGLRTGPARTAHRPRPASQGPALRSSRAGAGPGASGRNSHAAASTELRTRASSGGST